MTECLDQARHTWLVQALRSAKSWGVRPTEFLGVPARHASGWTDTDRVLAGALDMYEVTRVGSYGYPRRLTEGDYEGHFEVIEKQDNAQLALDIYRRRNQHGPAPGLVPRVVFTGEE